MSASGHKQPVSIISGERPLLSTKQSFGPWNFYSLQTSLKELQPACDEMKSIEAATTMTKVKVWFIGLAVLI